jgi:antitoxin HicB
VETYSIRIVWSDEDEGYVATSPEFDDLSAFGSTAREAAAQLELAVRAAIATYRDSGWTLPEPKRVHEHSGQLRVRLPRSLHGRLADEAERDGVSLNTLIVTCLAMRAGESAVKCRRQLVG